jgi:hypothetical protein
MLQTADSALYIDMGWGLVHEELLSISGRAASRSTTNEDDTKLRLLRETVFLVSDLIPVDGGGEIVSIHPLNPRHAKYKSCWEACQTMHLIRTCIKGEWRDVV